MNANHTFRAVLQGEFGHGAKGSMALTIHNWAGIQIKRAVFASLRKEQSGETVFDDSRLAFMKEKVENVVEQQEVETIDGMQWCRALAASLLFLGRHIKTPNPENGKKPVELTRYLRTTKPLIEEAGAYAADTSRDADNIRDNYAKMGLDSTEALNSLVKEKTAEFEGYFLPYTKEFWDAVKEFENVEDSDLIETCEEALTDHGIKPFQFLLDASVKMMDRQRARALKKQKTFIDPGVYALSQLADQLKAPTATPAA
jgi:hypothetical protein